MRKDLFTLICIISLCSALSAQTLWGPSLALGIGPRFSDEGVGFHFDSKLGFAIRPSDKLMVLPNGGFHGNWNDGTHLNFFSVGTYFSVMGRTSAKTSGLGVDYIFESLDTQEAGYRVSFKRGFANTLTYELAYQHVCSNEVQVTFHFDIGHVLSFFRNWGKYNTELAVPIEVQTPEPLQYKDTDL